MNPSFVNCTFFIDLTLPAKALEQLTAIEERLKTMPTNAEVDAKFAELEDALTSEIEQIKAEIEKRDDPHNASIVTRLDSLVARVKGIVEDAPATPDEQPPAEETPVNP